MDILSKKLINYKDESFLAKDGSMVTRYMLYLANESPDTSWESELVVSLPEDVVKKLKFNESKTVDSLRGRIINIMGLLYSNDRASVNEEGKAYSRNYLRFKVKDIAIESVK